MIYYENRKEENRRNHTCGLQPEENKQGKPGEAQKVNKGVRTGGPSRLEREDEQANRGTPTTKNIDGGRGQGG